MRQLVSCSYCSASCRRIRKPGNCQKDATAAAVPKVGGAGLASTILFGVNFAYDNVAALDVRLQNYTGVDHDTWEYESNILYSVYQRACLRDVTVCAGVFAAERDFAVFRRFFRGPYWRQSRHNHMCIVGLRRASCVLFWRVWQVFPSDGAPDTCDCLMYSCKQVSGRVLLGIGGESLNVVTTSTAYQWCLQSSDACVGVIGKWFTNDRMGTAIGIMLAVADLV